MKKTLILIYVITGILYGRTAFGALGFSPDTGGSLTTGLVSYWSLNEASGSRGDAVGTNTLTVEGSVGTTASGIGSLGNASTFNGTGDSLYINDADTAGTLDFNNHDFSYAFWYYQENKGDGNNGTFIARDVAGDRQLNIFVSDSDRTTRFYVNDAYTPSAGPAQTLGTWHHLAATFDYVGSGTSIMKLYIDGTATTPKTNASGMGISEHKFTVGSREYGTSREWLKGRLMHLGAWDKVLTQQEVTDLYNGGTGNPYIEQGGSGGETETGTSTTWSSIGATLTSETDSMFRSLFSVLPSLFVALICFAAVFGVWRILKSIYE